MTKEKIKNYLLPISSELHKKLKVYCIENNKMIKEIICEAIIEYLKARKAL
jgi:hypothetical protein